MHRADIVATVRISQSECEGHARYTCRRTAAVGASARPRLAGDRGGLSSRVTKPADTRGIKVHRLIESVAEPGELVRPVVAPAGPIFVRLIPRPRTAIGAAWVGDRLSLLSRLATADPPGRWWVRRSWQQCWISTSSPPSGSNSRRSEDVVAWS